MDKQELEQELEAVKKSLQEWTIQYEESQILVRRATEQGATAQRQIDMHTGNLQRLEWILERVNGTVPIAEYDD